MRIAKLVAAFIASIVIALAAVGTANAGDGQDMTHDGPGTDMTHD